MLNLQGLIGRRVRHLGYDGTIAEGECIGFNDDGPITLSAGHAVVFSRPGGTALHSTIEVVVQRDRPPPTSMPGPGTLRG